MEFLQKPTSRTLRSEVVDILRDAIVSGQLRPGEHLKENAIAAQLSVSRSPVREAFRQLEQEGLIPRASQAFVARPLSTSKPAWIGPPAFSRSTMVRPGGGLMDPTTPDRWSHLPIFEADAVYIENLTNLEAVPKSRAMVAALPPAVEGLECFTMRVVALV
jgi:DNA-binding transcriptional MocR family regulator